MRTYTNNAHIQHLDHHLLNKLHVCNRATIGREGEAHGHKESHMVTRSHTQTKTNKDKHRHIRVLANQDEGLGFRVLVLGFRV